MRMRSALSLLTATLAGGLLVGCGTEAPAPDKPTWVDDVKPILQANCFGCHGATANIKLGLTRWDIYDLTDPVYADLGFMMTTDDTGTLIKFTGAKAHAATFLAVLPSSANSMIPENQRMPPPPATKLTDRDVTVISNWFMTGASPGKHYPNHKPRIAWIQKPKRYEVVDDDGDQVLGQLVCADGAETVQVDRSGGHILPSAATPPCTVKLYDGFDLVTTNLK
jgi:hypothetical protein